MDIIFLWNSPLSVAISVLINPIAPGGDLGTGQAQTRSRFNFSNGEPLGEIPAHPCPLAIKFFIPGAIVDELRVISSRLFQAIRRGENGLLWVAMGQ